MKKKRFQSFCLAAALSAAAIFPAYGASGPGQSGEEVLPDGVTEEQWSRLKDEKLEFDEVYDRVEYFNPTVLGISDQINSSLDDVKYMHDGMRSSIRDLRDDAEDLKDNGGTNSMEGMIEYMTLKLTADGMSTGAESMKRTLDVLERPNSSAKSSITQVTKQLTYYANQVMIGYSSALSNKAMLEKMVEATQAGAEAQKLGQSIGTATEADVLSAQKGLLTAQSSLLKLDSTIDSLKRSLCLMTGYSIDSMLEIGALPEIDYSVIDAIDLEADIQKAVNNNYNLIPERRSSSKSTAQRNSKDASVEQNSQNITVQMQSYYQALKQARNAYDASCTAYDRAVLEKGKADRSHQLGIVSDITYLQTQMAFLQAEGVKQSAYNTLYQAYDTYKWGVEGIIISSAQ